MNDISEKRGYALTGEFARISFRYDRLKDVKDGADRVREMRMQADQKQGIFGQMELLFRYEEGMFNEVQMEEIKLLLVLVWWMYRGKLPENNSQVSDELASDMLERLKKKSLHAKSLKGDFSEPELVRYIETYPAMGLYYFIMHKIFFEEYSILRTAKNSWKHFLLFGFEILLDCFEEVIKASNKQSKFTFWPFKV
ncbi:MAG: hypothetical protein V4539_09950 [Bacteroidota bacterium]